MRVTDNIAYKCWENMIQRCTNPKATRYNRYGGRGIGVCNRWKMFENFIEDIGPRPSRKHSIDRINNDGNYEPGNVKWSDYIEQAQNKGEYVLKNRNMAIEFHRRRFRFTFNKKRYSYSTQEEALKAKEEMICNYNSGNY